MVCNLCKVVKTGVDRQPVSFPRSVKIRQTVIPGPLYVHSHQIPPGELQRPEDVPPQIFHNRVILPFAHLKRHAHEDSVYVNKFRVAVVGLDRVLRTPERVASANRGFAPIVYRGVASFSSIITQVHSRYYQGVPEAKRCRLEELVDLRIHGWVVSGVRGDGLFYPRR